MVIKMLEAVSDMLHFEGEIPLERVECARIMLDKIIEGMQFKEELHLVSHDLGVIDPPNKPTPPKKHTPTPLPEGQYQIEMSADFTIAAIKGNPPLAPDAQIELDGKVVAYKDVIGKAYNTVKIL